MHPERHLILPRIYAVCYYFFFTDSRFLSYGQSVGDSKVYLSGNRVMEIPINTPIVLYNKLMSHLYVCGHSLLTRGSLGIFFSDIKSSPGGNAPSDCISSCINYTLSTQDFTLIGLFWFPHFFRWAFERYQHAPFLPLSEILQALYSSDCTTLGQL